MTRLRCVPVVLRRPPASTRARITCSSDHEGRSPFAGGTWGKASRQQVDTTPSRVTQSESRGRM